MYKYRKITWWYPREAAYHVFHNDERIGIVNSHTIRVGKKINRTWQPHNKHFLTVGRREFDSRTAAAQAIPLGPIHHDYDAMRGAR